MTPLDVLGYDELVVALAIPFETPAGRGIAHLGYYPGDRWLESSQLAAALDRLAGDAPLLERLATRVADWIEVTIAPRGVGVVLQTGHVRTAALRGILREPGRTRREFLALASGWTA